MIKILLVILTGILFPALANCMQFEITGSFKKKPQFSTTLFIYRIDNTQKFGTLIDSVAINGKGQFYFKLPVDERIGHVYKISLQPNLNRGFSFPDNVAYFINNGERKIDVVFNSEDELYLAKYHSRFDEYGVIEKLQRLQDEYFKVVSAIKKSGNHEANGDAFLKMQAFQQYISAEAKKQVLKSGNPYERLISILFYCMSNNNLEDNPNRLPRKFFDSELPPTMLAAGLLKVIEGESVSVTLDSIFHHLVFVDRNNSTTDKIVLKSTFTVLGFTASWCPPCRRSNKKEIPVFLNQYQGDTSVTFISISFDTDKPEWDDAVDKDGIYWEHYWLKQKRGAVMPSFLEGNGIPFYFILNQNNLIAKVGSLKQVKYILESVSKKR